jgi:hypothetical protein
MLQTALCFLCVQSIPTSKLAGLAEMDAGTLKQQLALLRQSTQVDVGPLTIAWSW